MPIVVFLSLVTAEPRLLLASEDASALTLEAASAIGAATTIERVPDARDQEQEHAQLALDRALMLVALANKRATELKPDEAIRHYEEALRLFSKGAVAIHDFTHVIDCHVQLGATRALRNDDKGAVEEFKRAIAIGAKALDTQKYNPETVALFQRAARELERVTGGSLSITGQPAGAHVFVDGRRVGALPLSLHDLVAGTHWLVVASEGFHSFSSLLNVPVRGYEKSEVFLRPRGEPSALGLIARAEAQALAADEELLFSKYAQQRNVDELVVLGPSGTRGYSRKRNRVSERLDNTDAQSLARSLRTFFSAALEAPRVIVVPKTQTRVHPGIAWLPLGIAQFAEGRRLAGALFLSAELALLAVNIASAVVVLNDRGPQGGYRFVERDRQLQVVNLTAFGLFVATLIGGGIDGVYHR
jgi:PEGA domain